jgi:hypothetical protein
VVEYMGRENTAKKVVELIQADENTHSSGGGIVVKYYMLILDNHNIRCIYMLDNHGLHQDEGSKSQ